jgi:hypothetical protein
LVKIKIERLMKDGNNVVDKMTSLQELFKSTKGFVEKSPELASVMAFIQEQGENEFISIAYEAAALALQDLEKGTTLDTWNDFLDNYGSQHAVQIYIGLGWACGQKRLDPMLWIPELPPLLAWRIWDGYGYYNGFFRKRKVLQGIVPKTISEKGLSVYWQGVGRSFWYTSKGDSAQLQKVSTKIPSNYHVDFWRGIGIACTYVGGQSLTTCQEIWQLAGDYQAQLRAGAALAINSRSDANTIVKDTEMIAQNWFQLPVLKIIDVLKNKILDSTVANAAIYHTLIGELDERFDY